MGRLCPSGPSNFGSTLSLVRLGPHLTPPRPLLEGGHLPSAVPNIYGTGHEALVAGPGLLTVSGQGISPPAYYELADETVEVYASFLPTNVDVPAVVNASLRPSHLTESESTVYGSRATHGELVAKWTD